MREHWRRGWLIGLVLLSTLIGMVGGMVIDRQSVVVAASGPGQAQIDLNLIGQAWEIIQGHYVDREAVEPKALTYGAISGMVSVLGDTGHTTFMTPEMVKQQRAFTQGEFEGIGAEVEAKDGHVVIAAAMENSPAQKAGIRPGEIIVKVDGKDMSGLTLEQVVARVVGPAGTRIALTLQDPKTGATRELKLTRARIVVPTVTWQMLPASTVAQIRLAAFSERASADLQSTLAQVTEAGATGIVLDLRNNPGGLLEESVAVTSQFLNGGNVLQEKNADGEVHMVPVRAGVPKTDLPLVVLINNGTASAAEILTGALQDAHRATVIGEKTFGTGTVLNQFSLTDGSAIMLAVEEWLTPDGRVIWHNGIEPDVTVPLKEDAVPLTPNAARGMTVEQLRASGDSQLLNAMDRLVGTAIQRVPSYWFWMR